MTETYPPEVSTFKVIGRLVRGVIDGTDSDDNPDLIPIVGAKVTFSPGLTPPIFKVPTSSPPVTIFQESIVATTDANGFLKSNDDSALGVRLAYGLDSDILPTGWTWSVSIDVGGNFPVKTFSITGSPGGVVDLASVIPVPSNPGTETAQWSAVVSQVTSLRDQTLTARDQAVAVGNTNDTIMSGVLADPKSQSRVRLSGTYDRLGRTSIPQNVLRMFPGLLSKFQASVRAVLQGDRDAKILFLGDSTMDGVGGSTSGTFIKEGSWPSLMVPALDRVIAPTAHGLAVPPSNSGAVVSPYDSRWTLGNGWSWRKTGSLDGFIGFGGKGTNIQTSSSTEPLIFQDSRVLADSFDVYLVANSGPTGATFSIQSTGGTAVIGQTFSQASQRIMKVVVKAGTADTTNSVSITRTGGTGSLYVVGIEPFHSQKRKIRVANAGISGSNTTGWVTRPSGSPWHGVQFIKDYAPDLTIIDLGINDADPAGLIPPSTYASNMTELIQAAQLSGDVILKSMIPSDSTRFSNEQLLVNELKKFDLPLIDTFGYYGSWDSSFMSDSVHGNSVMYTDEADYISGILFDARPVTSGPYVDPATVIHSLPVSGFNRRFIASTLTGSDGSSVSSWADKAGSGTFLTPGGVAGANTAPILTTDGGRKVVAFDGVNHGIGQDLAMNQPHSVVLVGRFTSITGAPVQTLSGGIGSGNRSNLYIDGTAPGSLRLNAGSTLIGPAIDTNWHVFIGVFDGTSILSIDSIEVSASAGTNSRTKFTLGTLDGASKGAVNIAEGITYPFALTPSQRADLFADLKAYYAF